MPAALENASDLILQAARELLKEEGYQRLSMRKIAARCNLVAGTIYNYFPTKQDLVYTLMAEYWEEFFRRSSPHLENGEDIYTRLEGIYRELSLFVEQFQNTWIDLHDLRGRDPLHHSERQVIYLNRLYGLVADLLEEHFRQNARPFDRANLEDLAQLIVLNLLTMIYTHQLTYTTYERILRKLMV